MSDKAEATLTFFSRDPLVCPVCEAEFHREEMRTGRGRLIAGELTDELRRLYEPSQKYGEVYPLIYTILVCPVCYYAAPAGDFPFPSGEISEALLKQQKARQNLVDPLFPGLDFREHRSLPEGAASFVLAISSLDHFPDEKSPTIKQGLAALRAAWLLSDMHRRFPDENYDYLQAIMYNKARFFYTMAVEYETTGKESINDAGHLGPDIDKNYGYDGVLYMAALLEYYHGYDEDIPRRIENLERAKRTVARIFGMGRASRNKPAAILDKAKELHGAISREVKELEEKGI